MRPTATTLVSDVRRRLPIGLVALYGTLDQSAVVRALVTLRDCLADAPVALLLDLEHAAIPSPAFVRALVRLAAEAGEWPAAPIGTCAAPDGLAAQLDGTAVTVYPDVTAGLTAMNRLPIAPRVSLQLDPDERAPARSRALVHSTCGAWGISRVARLAELITSELITNAVLHARTRMALTLRLIEGALQIMVRDGDPRPLSRPPAGATGAHEGEHGRGLLVLDGMADAWGCTPAANGKVVWASIVVPRRP